MQVDVAFSLLSRDRHHAEAIQENLPDGISSFLYSSNQRELILARDGLNAFPDIFRNATLCVILFRPGWGETRWTRLEQKTLADRYMDEDSGFLMLLSLDTSSELPHWFPSTDIWVDLVAEGPVRTGEIIATRLGARSSETTFRATARSFGRRPVPIARYQNQLQRITEIFEAIRPEICDACTASIEYRPMARVTLLATGGYPACKELLCPRCAKDRGIRITIPRGLTSEQVYSSSNPLYHVHLLRLLQSPVLSCLTADDDLQALGVTNVGAIASDTWIELHVNVIDQDSKKLGFDVATLKANDLKCDSELIGFLKTEIRQAILSDERLA